MNLIPGNIYTLGHGERAEMAEKNGDSYTSGIPREFKVVSFRKTRSFFNEPTHVYTVVNIGSGRKMEKTFSINESDVKRFNRTVYVPKDGYYVARDISLISRYHGLENLYKELCSKGSVYLEFSKKGDPDTVSFSFDFGRRQQHSATIAIDLFKAMFTYETGTGLKAGEFYVLNDCRGLRDINVGFYHYLELFCRPSGTDKPVYIQDVDRNLVTIRFHNGKFETIYMSPDDAKTMFRHVTLNNDARSNWFLNSKPNAAPVEPVEPNVKAKFTFEFKNDAERIAAIEFLKKVEIK